MSFDPRKFKIGDTVCITHEVIRRERATGLVRWELKEFKSGQIGVIVGACVRQEGKICSTGNGCFDAGDGHYFKQSGINKFWMIRYGLTNKSVLAKEEHVYVAVVTKKFKLPVKAAPRCPMRQDQRDAMSRESKAWPRDAKGRWTDGPCIHAT